MEPATFFLPPLVALRKPDAFRRRGLWCTELPETGGLAPPEQLLGGGSAGVCQGAPKRGHRPEAELQRRRVRLSCHRGSGAPEPFPCRPPLIPCWGPHVLLLQGPGRHEGE